MRLSLWRLNQRLPVINELAIYDEKPIWRSFPAHAASVCHNPATAAPAASFSPAIWKLPGQTSLPPPGERIILKAWRTKNRPSHKSKGANSLARPRPCLPILRRSGSESRITTDCHPSLARYLRAETRVSRTGRYCNSVATVLSVPPAMRAVSWTPGWVPLPVPGR